MKRKEAIALLKEITSDKTVIPTWVSLENGRSDGYELRIKPEKSDSASLRPIVKKHNLSLQEVNGYWVIYGRHSKKPPKNYKLNILNRRVGSKKRIRFAVIDLKKSDSYPANFVCILPAYFTKNNDRESPFLKLFGDRSYETAKTLLAEALKETDDPEIKVEIRKRLKLLETKISRFKHTMW